ncbi:MAG: hypothetical protein N3A66_01245 [Planctomycetota bacterium]|nr:hypothetical protein [Planctomycetota bacterium]
MKRLLLISYAFPPLANAEAYVCAKNMRDLPGWEVTAVAAEASANGLAEDHSLDEYVASGFAQIIRIGPPAWLKPFPPRLARWFLFRLCALCRLPDFFYLNPALRARLASLPLAEYSALVTRSQWPSAHLAGAYLKKRHPHLRWLAHFSDPWVDNPYVFYYPPTAWLNLRWERQTILAADAISFVTPETLELVMAKYPAACRAKSFWLPHAFDRRLYEPAARPPREKYVIRSLGKFYGLRTPEPCYAALARLRREIPTLFKDVSIEFIGDFTRFARLLSAYPQIAPLVQIRPRVPYRESLRLMQTSHCLLLIDAPAACSIFFPSKLADYIGSGRFIAALTPAGAAQRIVAEVGGWSADPDNSEAVYGLFRRLLAERPESLPPAPSYEAERVRAILAERLAEICRAISP